jgi:hypothetical protein
VRAIRSRPKSQHPHPPPQTDRRIEACVRSLTSFCFAEQGFAIGSTRALLGFVPDRSIRAAAGDSNPRRRVTPGTWGDFLSLLVLSFERCCSPCTPTGCGDRGDLTPACASQKRAGNGQGPVHRHGQPHQRPLRAWCRLRASAASPAARERLWVW